MDKIDERIICLFEKRMGLTKEVAYYKNKFDLKVKDYRNDVVKKVTGRVCNIEIIEYTEELMMFIACVSEKYKQKLIKKHFET